jgi:hypothetical protein
MTKLILILFLTISFNSGKCQDISGVWFTPDISKGYEELYINDSNYVFCESRLFNCSPKYTYVLTQDSIFLYSDDDLRQNLRYCYTNSDRLTLFLEEDIYKYVRKKEVSKDYFLINTQTEYNIFMEEFRKRAIAAGIYNTPL